VLRGRIKDVCKAESNSRSLLVLRVLKMELWKQSKQAIATTGIEEKCKGHLPAIMVVIANP
jgi:hypothetical protein